MYTPSTDGESLIQDVLPASETGLPKGIAQNDDSGGSRLVLGSIEEASHGSSHAQEPKVGGRAEESVGPGGRFAPAQDDLPGPVRSYRLQTIGFQEVPVIGEGLVGHRAGLPRERGDPLDLKAHHPVRILYMGRRAEDEMIHDPEHGGVGPDAQGQSEDDGRREARLTAQAPGCVPQVLTHGLQKRPAPGAHHPSAIDAYQFPAVPGGVSEAPTGLVSRFPRGRTLLQELLLRLAEMEIQLRLHLSLRVGPEGAEAEGPANAREEAHCPPPSPGARRTLETASA